MKKEIIWLLALLLFSLVVQALLLGIESLSLISIAEIQHHDTYFIFPYYHSFIFICTILCFIIYSLRALKDKFKSIPVNCVLAISSLSIIFFLYFFNAFVNQVTTDINFNINPLEEVGLDTTASSNEYLNQGWSMEQIDELTQDQMEEIQKRMFQEIESSMKENMNHISIRATIFTYVFQALLMGLTLFCVIKIIRIKTNATRLP